MFAATSIFLDFRLPTATTWFYFSVLLAIALFFKFTRLLSIRNWDVLSLFLLVPGLLFIREAHNQEKEAPAQLATAVAWTGSSPGQGPYLAAAALAGVQESLAGAKRLLWLGYLWLLCGSLYFLIRCVIDLGLIRRPALSPNLNQGGLAWLGVALFVCLVSVAVQHHADFSQPLGRPSAGLEAVQRQAEYAADHVFAFDVHPWVGCTLALLSHLAVVAGLIYIGCRHFQDAHAGMAAATFYLLLPYTALHAGHWQHVWPVALVVWAVAIYRLPTLSGVLLGVAAGTVYFPALLFPLWLSFYWKRGTGRFTGAFTLAAGLSLAAVVLGDGPVGQSLNSVLNLCDWQPWKKPTTEGFWLWRDGTGVGWAYRIPVFIAYMAFVITTALWPAPKNLAHLLALSAAVLIGIQFWYSDQGGAYVLWYAPLLLLMAFRPNLADRRPTPIQSESDWLYRLGRAVARILLRLPRSPQPAGPVR